MNARFTVGLGVALAALMFSCQTEPRPSTGSDGGTAPLDANNSGNPDSGGGVGCSPGCTPNQFCNTELGVCQDRDSGDPLCNDSCMFAGDGECDDGGPMCAHALESCAFGSDCTDCGPRTEAQRPTAAQADIDCPCGVDCGDSMVCNSETMACEACSCDGRTCGSPRLGCPSCGQCDMGSMCNDAGQCEGCSCGSHVCGNGPTNNPLCNCGECGDGAICNDGQCETCNCGARQCGNPPGQPNCFCGDTCPIGEFCTAEGMCETEGDDPLCNNTCSRAGDGDCDDGGPMCDSVSCNFGTDCDDCGRRTEDQRPDPGGVRSCL